MQKIELVEDVADVSRVLPEAALTSSGLVYSASLEGGISRKNGKNGFRYYDAGGNRVRDTLELARIAALAIPPAYTDVVISANPSSHLQAIGIDSRGRRQYRYHADWSAERGKGQIRQTALVRREPSQGSRASGSRPRGEEAELREGARYRRSPNGQPVHPCREPKLRRPERLVRTDHPSEPPCEDRRGQGSFPLQR